MSYLSDYILTVHLYLDAKTVSQAIYSEAYQAESDIGGRMTAVYLATQNPGVRLVFNFINPRDNTWRVHKYSEEQRRDCLEYVPAPEIRQDIGAQSISLLVSNRGDRSNSGPAQSNGGCRPDYRDSAPSRGGCGEGYSTTVHRDGHVDCSRWPADRPWHRTPPGYYRSYYGALVPIREPQ